MNAADRLEYGAALIEERGWFQGKYVGGGDWCAMPSPTSNCALTAIYGGNFDDKACMGASEALRAFIGSACIATWNNSRGQTKENVIATMRACAAIWRAKHEESVSVVAVESSAETVSA